MPATHADASYADVLKELKTQITRLQQELKVPDDRGPEAPLPKAAPAGAKKKKAEEG